MSSDTEINYMNLKPNKLYNNNAIWHCYIEKICKCKKLTKIIEGTLVLRLDHVRWILFFGKKCTDESLKDVNRLKDDGGRCI